MRYTERLRVPVSWWLICAAALAVLWVAVAAATGTTATVAVTAVATAVVVVVLLRYGAARVTVDTGTLAAGRASIPLEHLGEAEPLTGESARLARGRDCDPRAYLLLRPYLAGAVRVRVTDPDDPTPYWLIATRHPQRLADALGGGKD
ncbi:MAG TPA: DUF3093 domain-containing protein [Kribbellaceae bacterium]